MEAIIHPGMPKTGSSSIQATLVSAKPEGWILPDTPTGNMSGQFSLFFEDNPEEHLSFKNRGLGADDVAIQRKLQFESFENKLKAGVEQGLNAVFTAERITGSSEAAVRRVAELYRSHGYKNRVIAYVRKPFSFLQSAFQQNIKVKKFRLSLETTEWPRYRHRFEKLDQIFGRENVQLTVFEPKDFEGRDVCIDFLKKIGVPITPEQVVRINESMSMTACAMLYAQRNLGEGLVQGVNGASMKNNAFIATLSRIQGEPLRFKRSFVAPLFEKHRADLDWMEERLGVSLFDLPDEDPPSAIGSEEELLAIADQQQDELEEQLLQEIRRQGQKPRDRLVRNLELLRKMHY